MKRSEAEKLVGKKVLAWTAANGEYVGTLVEITPSRPWRGRVRITGVLSPADIEFTRSGFQRWGKRPGDLIEVGHSSIKEVPEETTGYSTYLAALEALRDEYTQRVAQFQSQFETFTAAGMVGPASRAESDLRFSLWYVNEMERLIEQEPERLARMESQKLG